MARLGSLRKRLEALEASHSADLVVSTFAEGPDGQLWLTLADGRSFEGEEAKALLDKVIWPEGAYFHLIGVDLDLALGRKPPLDEAGMAELQRKSEAMIARRRRERGELVDVPVVVEVDEGEPSSE